MTTPTASPKIGLPRIGAHTPTSGGMAKRSIGYAETIKAEAIQVFTSNPRGWATPEANPDADQAFREKCEELERSFLSYCYTYYIEESSKSFSYALAYTDEFKPNDEFIRTNNILEDKI